MRYVEAYIRTNNKEKNINLSPERDKISYVKRAYWLIKDIRNPTEKVQLAAVTNNGLAIQYINDPSIEVQWAAIKSNSFAIEYIAAPSEEMKLFAVKQNCYVIKFIKDPSDELQQIAVESLTSNYQFVRSITVIKNTRQYWDQNFYWCLKNNIFNLTEQQHQEILEEYYTLQLFK